MIVCVAGKDTISQVDQMSAIEYILFFRSHLQTNAQSNLVGISSDQNLKINVLKQINSMSL